ncbi:MAG TPA: GTP cyclohydrolase I FolE [Actinomycetota bacterium]
MEPDRLHVVSAETLDAERTQAAVRELLAAIGEDPARPGLVDTPARVAASLADLLSGYGEDPVAVLEPLEGERGDGLIMVRDIRVVSLCEHHLLPFVGTAAVAYLPGEDGRITGLSKLARVVEVLSRRLQVQERLVREIADAIEAALAPRGVFVLIEAEQMCMTLRGARASDATTVTTDARGPFADDPEQRAELAALARGGSPRPR